MLSERDRLIKFVAKLIELTQDEKIKWYLKEPRPSLSNDKNFAGIVYASEYGGKCLGLYRRKEQVHRPLTLSIARQNIASGTSGYSGFGDSDIEWGLVTVLEIIDYADNCLWPFPQLSGLGDLYDAVQYHVSGVKDLIDSVLGEEEG